MNSKKWIMLCAVVVVILAVLLIWKPFGSNAQQNEPAIEPSPMSNAVTQPAETEPVQIEKAEVTSQPEEPSAYMLEDEGDLIIVVPEDQESNGF